MDRSPAAVRVLTASLVLCATAIFGALLVPPAPRGDVRATQVVEQNPVSEATDVNDPSEVAVASSLGTQTGLVVWLDTDAAGSTNRVRAQLVSSDGTPNGSAFSLYETATIDVEVRDLAVSYAFNEDRFLVVWEEHSSTMWNAIRGAWVNPGAPVSNSFDIFDGGTATPIKLHPARPSVAYVAGAFLVVYDTAFENDTGVRVAVVMPDQTSIPDAQRYLLELGSFTAGNVRTHFRAVEMPNQELGLVFYEVASLSSTTGTLFGGVVWYDTSGALPGDPGEPLARSARTTALATGVVALYRPELSIVGTELFATHGVGTELRAIRSPSDWSAPTNPVTLSTASTDAPRPASAPTSDATYSHYAIWEQEGNLVARRVSNGGVLDNPAVIAQGQLPDLAPFPNSQLLLAYIGPSTADPLVNTVHYRVVSDDPMATSSPTAGPVHHIAMFTPNGTLLTACSEVTLELEGRDEFENVTGGGSFVELCLDGAVDLLWHAIPLTNTTQNGVCLSGELPASGSATVLFSQRGTSPVEARIATPPSASNDGITFEFVQGPPSSHRSSFSVDGADGPIELATYSGSLTARFFPRDACGLDVSLDPSTFGWTGPAELWASAPVKDEASGGWISELRLTGCPTDPGFLVGATIDGQPVIDEFGSAITQEILASCVAPLIELSVEDSDDAVIPGVTVPLKFRVKNTGEATLTGAELRLLSRSGLTLVGATLVDGTALAATADGFSLPEIGAGAELGVIVKAKVDGSAGTSASALARVFDAIGAPVTEELHASVALAAPVVDIGGCACGSSGASGSAAWFGLASLALLLQRRVRQVR